MGGLAPFRAVLCGAPLLVLPILTAACGSLPSGPSPREILREEIEFWDATRLAEANHGWPSRPEARPVAIRDMRCRPAQRTEEAVCFYDRITAGGQSTRIENRHFLRSGNSWEMQVEPSTS